MYNNLSTYMPSPIKFFLHFSIYDSIMSLFLIVLVIRSYFLICNKKNLLWRRFFHRRFHI